MQSYKEVLKGLFYGLHSRRFLLAIVGSHLAYLGARYSLPAEYIAMMMGPITAFILGESYQGGKGAEAQGNVSVAALTSGSVLGAGTLGALGYKEVDGAEINAPSE